MERWNTCCARAVFIATLILASCGSSPQLGPTGSPCKSNGDCRSNTCGNNVCMAGPIGSPCAASADCQSSLCSSGTCSGPLVCDGFGCPSPADMTVVPDMTMTGGDCFPTEQNGYCANEKSCSCIVTQDMQDECQREPQMCATLPANYNSCTPSCDSCGFDLPRGMCYTKFKCENELTNYEWIFSDHGSIPVDLIASANGQLRVSIIFTYTGANHAHWTCSDTSCWQQCKADVSQVKCWRMRFDDTCRKAYFEEFSHDPSIDMTADWQIQTAIQGRHQ